MAVSPHDGQGAPTRTQRSPQDGFQKWPPNTKWAYFKNLPGNLGGNRSHGWVRVGSKLWGEIHQYNNGTHKVSIVGGRGGGMKTVPNDPIHASRKATQAWNPESPRGQIILQGGGSGAHPGDGRTGGNDPGRGGEQGAKQRGTDQPVTAGQTPGTTHTRDHTQQQVNAMAKMLGNPNTGQKENLSDAQALAGLQFDAGINDARTQLADQHAQGAQDLADIGNWYKQIQGQLAAGTGANAAAATQAAGTTDNVTRGLLNDIGGSANDSAGAVAAQGAGQSASLLQQALLQKQFATNMGAALGGQQAGQMSAQQALNSQAEQALGQQIRDLLGQRGQAVVQNQQNIRAFNNSVGNQNFANKISLLESIIGAKTALGNQKLQKLQIQQAQGGGAGSTQFGTPGNPSWHQMTLAQRYATAKILVAPGPDGKVVPLQTALQRAASAGYDPALVRPFLQSFYGN